MKVIRAAKVEVEAIATLRVSLVEKWPADWQTQNEIRELREIVVPMDSGWSPECDGEAADAGKWAVLKTSAVTWNGYDETQNKRLPTLLKPRELAQVRGHAAN